LWSFLSPDFSDVHIGSDKWARISEQAIWFDLWGNRLVQFYGGNFKRVLAKKSVNTTKKMLDER